MKHLPKGRIVRLGFDIELPETATVEQVRQWLMYELMHIDARLDGPLAGHNVKMISAVAVHDTGMHLEAREDVYPDGKGGVRPVKRVWRVPQPVAEEFS